MINTPLRILVVPPMYGGSLPMAERCTAALTSLGHTVRQFDAPSFYSAFSALGKLHIPGTQTSQLENSFLRLLSQSVGMVIDSFAPNLVLALAQAPLDRLLLQKLRSDKITTVMWFVEDYKVFPYWRVFAPLYSCFAVIQKEPFFSELAAIGQKNVCYLPCAADPSFHRHIDLTDEEIREFSSDIAFVGAGYPNRRIAFRAFDDADFKIWGSDWDGEQILAHHIQRNGERICAEDCVKIYSATKININLHSSIYAEKQSKIGDFVNPRTFELASIGAFQVVDKRELMSELFADDELATFCNFDDMAARAFYFLEHPEERSSYTEKAKKRILAEHTYKHRMQTLLDFLKERIPDFDKSAKTATRLPDGIPLHVKEQLATLLDELELPPSVPFDDVVERLRQKKKQLSAAECTILFLDAWCKQYEK